METIVERSAALDVHKASVMACVRVPAAGGSRDEHVGAVSDHRAGLLTLADWLEAHGVTQVAMEATGVYWKPVQSGPGGPLCVHACQCAARQAGPGP